MTTLPNHNWFFRVVYILLVLLMLAFMAGLISAYWPEQAEGAVSNRETKKSENAIQLSRDEQSNKQSDKPIQVEPFELVALKTELTLTGDIEAQLQSLWLELYSSGIYRHFNKTHGTYRVYLIYEGFIGQGRSTNVYLGINTEELKALSSLQSLKSEKVHLITHPGGYFQPSNDVLASWQSIDETKYKFQNDFEVYQLNQDLETLNKMAFLSLNERTE